MIAAISPWTWVGLGGWVFGGLWFIAWETLGMLRSNDGFPTLTNVVKRYVPKWALAMALGWLAWHFLAGPAGNRVSRPRRKP